MAQIFVLINHFWVCAATVNHCQTGHGPNNIKRKNWSKKACFWQLPEISMSQTG